MKFSKQTIYCNINELLLVMLLTQYMGALGNFENAIPKPVAHVIYLVYNTLFMLYMACFMFCTKSKNGGLQNNIYFM